MITIIANPAHKDTDEQSPCRFRRAFSDGLTAIGVEYKLASAMYAKSKIVACWGWRQGKLLRARGHDVIVLERGYIGDRYAYTSLGWNGLNGHAEFPEYENNDDRFRAHGIDLKPWKRKGDYILILGQVSNDASLQGRNMIPWYKDIARQASLFHGLDVYFRPHPHAGRRCGYLVLPGHKNLEGTLEDAIDGAFFTIAYNSNSCLDSIMRGVPSYAGDKGTMVYDLCMPHINQLHYPGRQAALNRVSYTQWTAEEIATGKPIEKLLCGRY